MNPRHKTQSNVSFVSSNKAGLEISFVNIRLGKSEAWESDP